MHKVPEERVLRLLTDYVNEILVEQTYDRVEHSFLAHPAESDSESDTEDEGEDERANELGEDGDGLQYPKRDYPLDIAEFKSLPACASKNSIII